MAYGFLLGCFVLVSADGVVGYVEGMIKGGRVRVLTAFHDERVLIATDHVDLRY